MNNIKQRCDWRKLVTQPAELTEANIQNAKKIVWNHLEMFQQTHKSKQNITLTNIKNGITKRNIFNRIWGFSIAGVTAMCLISVATLLQPKIIQISSKIISQSSSIINRSNFKEQFSKSGENIFAKTSTNFVAKLIEHDSVNLLLIQQGRIQLSTSGKLKKPLLLSSKKLSVLITGTTVSFNQGKSSTFELLEGSIKVMDKPIWDDDGVNFSDEFDKMMAQATKVSSPSKITVSNKNIVSIKKALQVNQELFQIYTRSQGKKAAQKLLKSLKKNNHIALMKASYARAVTKRYAKANIPFRPKYEFILKNNSIIMGQLINRKNKRLNILINGNIMVLDSNEIKSMKEILPLP